MPMPPTEPVVKRAGTALNEFTRRLHLRRQMPGKSPGHLHHHSCFELLTRIELVTSSLPRKCSTTELQQHFPLFAGANVSNYSQSTKKICENFIFISYLAAPNTKTLNQMKRILIVGAGGQIGSELTVYLRSIYGGHNVVATDVRESKTLGHDGPF